MKTLKELSNMQMILFMFLMISPHFLNVFINRHQCTNDANKITYIFDYEMKGTVCLV